jgi:hypothetical protein
MQVTPQITIHVIDENNLPVNKVEIRRDWITWDGQGGGQSLYTGRSSGQRDGEIMFEAEDANVTLFFRITAPLANIFPRSKIGSNTRLRIYSPAGYSPQITNSPNNLALNVDKSGIVFFDYNKKTPVELTLHVQKVLSGTNGSPNLP